MTVQKTVPSENGFQPATAADIGLSRKTVFEARQIRDAEKAADPGSVKRTLDEQIERGAVRNNSGNTISDKWHVLTHAAVRSRPASRRALCRSAGRTSLRRDLGWTCVRATRRSYRPNRGCNGNSDPPTRRTW